MRAHRPRPGRRRRLIFYGQELRLYDDRNYRSGIQTELLVPEDAQRTGDLTAVRCNRDPGVVVGREDLIKPLLRPSVLCFFRLG